MGWRGKTGGDYGPLVSRKSLRMEPKLPLLEVLVEVPLLRSLLVQLLQVPLKLVRRDRHHDVVLSPPRHLCPVPPARRRGGKRVGRASGSGVVLEGTWFGGLPAGGEAPVSPPESSWRF